MNSEVYELIFDSLEIVFVPPLLWSAKQNIEGINLPLEWSMRFLLHYSALEMVDSSIQRTTP